ncbi:hypothetical protein [Parabacteroides sp.]
MKKKTLVELRRIANLIQQQSPCEITAFLDPFCDEWKFVFLNGCLTFMEDEKTILVIPLSTIYGTLKADNILYLLCKNSTLHYFDRRTHQYWIAFLDNMHEDILDPTLN